MADDEEDFIREFFVERELRLKRKGARAEWERGSQVEIQAVSWLWWGYLARRKISMFAGNSAMGKSQISLAFAAALTKTHEWPDKEIAPDGSVLILSAEDDPADTMVPRLMAAGADCDRVHFLKAVYIDDKPAIFSAQANMGLIAEKVRLVGDVALVIIDPITAFLGGDIDSHRITEVRAALQPMKDFVEALDVACLIIAHPPKSPGTEALNYVAGSGAFVHGPRLAFMVVTDPDLPDRRLFIPVKNTFAKTGNGLGYFIEGVAVERTDGTSIMTSRVSWDSAPITMTANEALAKNAENLKANVSKKVDDFLQSALQDGKQSSREIIDEGIKRGFSERTIQRRRKEKGIKSYKDEFHGKLWWELGDDDDPL